MLIALLLFAATVQLVDERFEIPAGEWRYVDLALNQEPARVRCSFETVPRGAPVKIGLVRAEDLPDLRKGEPLATGATASAGAFESRPRDRGRYAMVVDNRHGGRPVNVLLRIDLDFHVREAARYADPMRQLGIIAGSFAIFFGAVAYSARKLLTARQHG
jgi:hypothetical protein